MTYSECEKYISENIRKVRYLDKIGDLTVAYCGLVIGSNTVETRDKEEIHKQFAEHGRDNREVLIESGKMDEDLNVFYIGQMKGQFVIFPLAQVLSQLPKDN